MSLRDRLRHWLGVPEPSDGVDNGQIARALHSLNRQIGELRGVMHHQSDYTVEALHRAGWLTDADRSQHEALQGALRMVHGDRDVIAGPWTGEVGFELMYWIPFLNWLVEQGLDPKRLVVLSRGGAAPWYRHLTSRYVDILDLITADDFRERTAGKKKQYDVRHEFDRELTAAAGRRLGLVKPAAIHPSAMFRLFAGLWRRRSTLSLVESFTTFRALVPPGSLTAEDLPAGLPPKYVAAKFYFSKAFPETQTNRAFIDDLLRNLSRQVPVALMSTSVQLDEHNDYRTSGLPGSSGLYVVDAHRVPERNLDVQSRILCGARGFIGTYGGFSYLAPFYGVRSVSFFSRRIGFEPHHLELADRVFDRLLPGGFLALHCRAVDLVEPAVTRWMTETPHPSLPEAGKDAEAAGERVTT